MVDPALELVEVRPSRTRVERLRGKFLVEGAVEDRPVGNFLFEFALVPDLHGDGIHIGLVRAEEPAGDGHVVAVVLLLEIVAHVIQAALYRSAVDLDVDVAARYEYGTFVGHVFHLGVFHVGFDFRCRECRRLRLGDILMAGLGETAALSELQQTVARLGFARHGDHVADGQVVGFALECVDACTVLLEEYSLLVGGDDAHALDFECRAGAGFEHFGQRSLVALYRETSFGKLDVVTVAGQDLQCAVVDARDTCDGTALVGRDGILCIGCGLQGADFVGLSVLGLHGNIALVRVAVPGARFRRFGLRVFDLYVLRFVFRDFVCGDGDRGQRFGLPYEHGLVVGRNLQQTAEELCRCVAERYFDDVAALEGVVRLADREREAGTGILCIVGKDYDEGLLISPPLVRDYDTAQRHGSDRVRQFFSIGSGVGCHDEPAEFRNIRIRFTFLDLPYGARARVGGAHVTGGRYGDGTRTRSGVRGDGYGYCCRTFAAGLRQLDPCVGFDLPVELSVKLDFEVFRLGFRAIERQRLGNLDFRDQLVVLRVVVRTGCQCYSQREGERRAE